MIIRIACADTNTEYLERLIDVLEDSAELHLSMYSDAAILRENAYLGRFDVLLLDPSMYSRDLPIEKIPVTIMLAGENRIPYECETLPAIRKYQHIVNIRRSILEICSKNPKFGGTSNGVGGTAAVVAVYSPIGGAGKTTAALIASARLAAHGKRALYLNLEHFASDGFYLTSQPSDSGLSAIMEQLGEKGADLFMKSCIRTKADNFFYIKHFDSPNDWNVLSGEECAALLYAAISSDTGGFRYSNTTKETHLRAAALVERIDVADISHKLFGIKSLAMLRAEQLGFEKLHLFEGGRIGIASISFEDKRFNKLQDEHLSTLVDLVRSVAGVEIAVAIRQPTEARSFRVSTRANIDFDVAAVCATFGGGGHRRAAGATVEAKDTAEAERLVLNAILAEMRK
ncbi:MAG: hypothetical protein IKI93_09070 [Clostridia bacterium]|nr:hypothetical protein [Clostridia bacterium]